MTHGHSTNTIQLSCGDSFDEALVKFDLRARHPARVACAIAPAIGWTRVGAEGNLLHAGGPPWRWRHDLARRYSEERDRPDARQMGLVRRSRRGAADPR